MKYNFMIEKISELKPLFCIELSFSKVSHSKFLGEDNLSNAIWQIFLQHQKFFRYVFMRFLDESV